MGRITKFVNIATATALATLDITTVDELRGLKNALIIMKMGFIGSDAAYDTSMTIHDGQREPVVLMNHATIAGGWLQDYITDINFTPKSGEISIFLSANLGAGDMVLFIDAIIPS